jgi:hypothetical protein
VGKCTALAAALCVLATASPAAAQDDMLPDLGVEIHGFISQGFILSFENEYLARAKTGSVEFSEIGLNFTRVLTDELRLGLQFFAHDLGPFGNYAPQIDWGYIDYHPRDYFAVRVGRMKIPFGLYNELNDLDVARVPILLPQSIYQADHREFAFSLTGGELYGDVPLGPAGSLEYRLYGGTFPNNPPDEAPPAPGVSISNLTQPYVYGGRLLWFTPLDGLLGGFSYQKLRFDADYALDPALQTALASLGLVPADLVSPFRVEFRVPRWIASLQYAAHDLDISAEYSRWTGEFKSPIPLLLTPHIVNERYYVMASYRVNPWFTPGLYYSGYFVNVEDRKGREQYTHDVAATLRFDINAHWLLKLEGHVMRGTATLDNRALNNGVNQNALAPTWGAFLVKTTAYF